MFTFDGFSFFMLMLHKGNIYSSYYFISLLPCRDNKAELIEQTTTPSNLSQIEKMMCFVSTISNNRFTNLHQRNAKK